MPLLGRCKECDFALFVASASDAVPADGLRDVRNDGRAYRTNDGFLARCPNRHKVFVLRRIKGTYSEAHECDARCLNAKGHSCTCSCGGLNHGRGHTTTNIVHAQTTGVDLSGDPTEKQTTFIRQLLAERNIPDRVNDAGDIISGADRREKALTMLDDNRMTKKEATTTISWLLTLPKE